MQRELHRMDSYPLKALYGTTPVSEFGPLALAEVPQLSEKMEYFEIVSGSEST